jgi:5-methyltetrahydrofolate--homocysteine methyltransferase
MRPAELERLLAGAGPLLLDGALGTLLMSMGLETGRAPEAWVLEHPDRVEAAHRLYVEAGSDVFHTVTFGANPIRLEEAGLGAACCRELNARAVEIARRAAAARPGVLVAGDVGPTSRFFPPVGNATEGELRAAFEEQAAALAGAGIDLFSIETMVDAREARIALEAARATGLPVVVSMTFEAKKRGAFTMMGDPLGPSLRALAGAGAAAVGLNCSLTSGAMVPLVREARAALPPGVRLCAQPNAGIPRPTATGIVYDAHPDSFAADLAEMAAAGADLLGGCCGTDPDFIRATRARLAASPRPAP